MENVDLRVKVLRLDHPKEIDTSYGFTHTLVEGKVEDQSGSMKLAVWNELIDQMKLVGVETGDIVDLNNCFITSFKGVLSVNVGRDSEIKQYR